MHLYFIASLSRNTVQVYILIKQMSHGLKCVLIVYAFMHFNFVNRVKVMISNKYVNHADFFNILN